MQSGDLDPIQILSSEFSVRSQRNPRYSLRSFAKSLGLSHTALSLVLSGKRPLSRKSALRVAEKLELTPVREAALFVDKKAPKKSFSADYERIDLDTFHLISDWVHYAILSLTEISDTKFQPKWIAQRLGINETLAKISMSRLVDLGLLKEVNGRWRQTGKSIKVENGVSTTFTRKFHQKLLEKAQESLENDPIELRDFSSVTLALDPKDIPYAKERIRQFRRELTAELEGKNKPKEVYNITVQIFPVTKGK